MIIIVIVIIIIIIVNSTRSGIYLVIIKLLANYESTVNS